MCGRYASSRRPEELMSYFQAQEQAGPPLPASFNVAPTDPVYLIVQQDRRQLRVARWGLVPPWAADTKIGARYLNARAETLTSTAVYRAAYRRRRCLLPADGYFEWQVQPGGKQPYFLSALDGAPLAMAGLYERWSPPAGDPVWTCTVVTTSAAADHAPLHHRTPLLVPVAHWTRWLDPTDPDPGDLLVPARPGVLDAWPVDRAVGSVRNNNPTLVARLDRDRQQLPG